MLTLHSPIFIALCAFLIGVLAAKIMNWLDK